MSAIDWSAVRARLDEARQALERAGTPDAAAILRVRARALAQEPAGEAPAGDSLEVVEFSVAEERYAVESRWVRAVHPLKELTPLPGTPPFVLGVVNLRGRVVAVIDIRKFFDLPDGGLTDLNRVVVIANAAMEVGVLADRVAGSASLPAGSLQSSLPTLVGIRERYLKGVTGERLAVLDADRILSDPRIVVRDAPDN